MAVALAVVHVHVCVCVCVCVCESVCVHVQWSCAVECDVWRGHRAREAAPIAVVGVGNRKASKAPRP